MKKDKLFTKEEKAAIEKVLDMGFAIKSNSGHLLSSDFDGIKISEDNCYSLDRHYKNISSAITRICILESKFHNGEL